MKVILLKDVKNQGKKDDIIEVSDGYAKNYLIKNNLGVPYTKGSKNHLDKEIDIRNKEEQKLIDSLNQIKDKLENKELVFKVKIGANERVFGKVSTKQISDELKKLGFDIDKKCIKEGSEIDSLGTHKVLVELHKKVSFYINIKLEK